MSVIFQVLGPHQTKIKLVNSARLKYVSVFELIPGFSLPEKQILKFSILSLLTDISFPYEYWHVLLQYLFINFNKTPILFDQLLLIHVSSLNGNFIL